MQKFMSQLNSLTAWVGCLLVLIPFFIIMSCVLITITSMAIKSVTGVDVVTSMIQPMFGK